MEKLNVYRKLNIGLYVARRYVKDYKFRKWALSWMEGDDRTEESAAIFSIKGYTIAGKLSQAAEFLARVEKDPEHRLVHEKAALDCIETAILLIKKEKEPDFEFEKYYHEVDKYRDYIPASWTESTRAERGDYRRRHISKEMYIEMSVEQNHRCWICGKFFTYCKKPNGRYNTHRLVVDHDNRNPNEKKNIRGLLCHNCNCGIGLFMDNPETMRAAADYIEYFTRDRQR